MQSKQIRKQLLVIIISLFCTTNLLYAQKKKAKLVFTVAQQKAIKDSIAFAKKEITILASKTKTDSINASNKKLKNQKDSLLIAQKLDKQKKRELWLAKIEAKKKDSVNRKLSSVKIDKDSLQKINNSKKLLKKSTSLNSNQDTIKKSIAKPMLTNAKLASDTIEKSKKKQQKKIIASKQTDSIVAKINIQKAKFTKDSIYKVFKKETQEKAKQSKVLTDSIKKFETAKLLPKNNIKQIKDSIKASKKLEVMLKLRTKDSIKMTLIDSFTVKAIKKSNQEELTEINHKLTINPYGADEIFMAFSNDQFDNVIKGSKVYLQKFPNDTNIIIKTGLSYLYKKKYKQAFETIDSLFANKDSLIQFYSIQPFINQNAKQKGVYEEIVKHCQLLLPNSIWTNFTRATMLNTRDTIDKALIEAKICFDKIQTQQEANSLGYFYPTILFHNNFEDSAINMLKVISNQFPNNINLKLNLYQFLFKQKRYDEAYVYIDQLLKKEPNNEDYFQDKLDLCIQLKKYDEACNLLKEVNQDYSYDDKIFKAKCVNEFVDIPFQHQSNYTWKVSQKGESFTMNIIVDASLENKVSLQYSNTGKASNKGIYSIQSFSYDTSRTIDAYFFNQTKHVDSTYKLAMWISKKCYNEIETTGQTILDLGTGQTIFTLLNIEDDDDANIFTDRVKVNDQQKLVNTYHLWNSDTNEQIWILKNKSNPLIVKLDANCTIELSTVIKQ